MCDLALVIFHTYDIIIASEVGMPALGEIGKKWKSGKLGVKNASGTLRKILGFGILADFLVSSFSEIPSLLMGPNWKPDFGDTPNESRLET